MIDILDVLGAMTPFIILILGWLYNNQQKKNKKAEEDAAELKKLQEGKQNTDIANAIQRLDQATSDMKQQSHDIKQLSNNFATLTALSELNGQYTHELAQMVMVLAEGLRDQHLDGNITRAVEKYRKFEADALGSIVTGKSQLFNNHTHDDQ